MQNKELVDQPTPNMTYSLLMVSNSNHETGLEILSIDLYPLNLSLRAQTLYMVPFLVILTARCSLYVIQDL
jgi:hypothetical protein